eukprot:c30876_g1_i1 orf=56-289(+)
MAAILSFAPSLLPLCCPWLAYLLIMYCPPCLGPSSCLELPWLMLRRKLSPCPSEALQISTPMAQTTLASLRVYGAMA